MTRTTAQPNTLQGSKTRLRASHELLEKLNPAIFDLCGLAAAIGIVSRASEEPASGPEDARHAMLTLAGILQRETERIEGLYTQALKACDLAGG
jgi:hypothetical protein